MLFGVELPWGKSTVAYLVCQDRKPAPKSRPSLWCRLNIVNWEGNYIKAPTTLLSSLGPAKFSLQLSIYQKKATLCTHGL